ncbi:MAG: ASPIC/UnbV domain-containing protein [Dehalococcoidia bacterium]
MGLQTRKSLQSKNCCIESSHPGNWLQVHLTGIKSSRTPIGATIRVQTESGLQIRQLSGGGSYGSTHDPRLHFGLGEAETVQKLEVAWPSGRIQQLTEIPVSQLIHLIEPES